MAGIPQTPAGITDAGYRGLTTHVHAFFRDALLPIGEWRDLLEPPA